MTNETLMRIDGKAYREAKPVGASLCGECAFCYDSRRCGVAFDVESNKAFGGDCNARNVIYEEVPNS